MLSLPSESAASDRTGPGAVGLPPLLVRETTKGRLIVLAPSAALAGPMGLELKALSISLCIVTNGGPGPAGSLDVVPAEELEERTTHLPAGSIIGIGSCAALGTPRHPTRLRAWLEEILRHRTLLFLGADPDSDPVQGAIRKLILPKMQSRHFDVPVEDIGAFLERLAEAARNSARGVVPNPPPRLPAIPSPWGLRLLALAGVLASASWLALYVSHGAAHNWRWLQLTPAVLLAFAALAALWPRLADMAAGRQLVPAECYARALARWSRWPRAPIAAGLLLLGALSARGLSLAYVPATFLVLEEAAQVTSDVGVAGTCRGEDPCTLIVPRFGRLRFDGAEGSCSVDFEPKSGMIVIDLQSEDGCGAYGDEKQPKPRGG